MKKLLSLAALLLTPQVAFASHQYIQCSPVGRETEDRAVVAIWPEKYATLFMSSDLNTDENSGVIRLKLIIDAPESDGWMVFEGENEVATFNVLLPAASFWIRSDDLKLQISMRSKSDSRQFSEDLGCFSRLYE